MLEYAQSQFNKTVQHALVREFSKTVANSNADLGMAKKIQRGKLFEQEKRIWTTKNIRRDGRAWSKKNLAKPKEIATKNKSGNPDSTNNSLVHPEETLDNENLQATTRSGHNGRGQANAQTEFTCAMPQVERILNMYEIGYEINISLNFSFTFGGIILILLNIKSALCH